jgi:hypothetical protein
MTWREVSTDDHPAWRAVFNAEPRAEKLRAPCPLCGASTLHRWYAIDGHDAIELRGNHYVGRGRLWEWCSSCGSFEHFMDGYVPDWWESTLIVPHESLAYDPGAIEASRLAAAH